MSIFEKLLEALSALPSELYVFIISMLPLIELRGAVPVGAVLEVPFYLNFIISVVGNLLPVPFILWLIPKVLDFMERFKIFRPIVAKLRGKANKNSKKLLTKDATDVSEMTGTSEGNSDAGNSEAAVCEEKDTETSVEKTEDSASGDASAPRREMSRTLFTSLMLFVALPLPGTGAWSGGLVAALFNLPKKRSLLAIGLGVLVCGAIMTLASYGIIGFLSFLL